MAISLIVPQTVLAHSGLPISRVGLGLSRLHRILSAESRLSLIRNARAMGITHFDTAPLYGDGLAERMLGQAIGHERGLVTIASKSGLLATRWVGGLGTAGWPFYAGRAILRRAGLIRWPHRSFSAEQLRRSLTASLRAIRTDYLDILFLHEPLFEEIARNDDLFAEMVRCKDAGKIRLLGISGPIFPEVMERFGGVIDVVQTMESDWQEGVGTVPDITFGALGGSQKSESGGVGGGPCASLAHALSRRKSGAVIVGTTKTEHLRQLVQAACAANQHVSA